MTNQVILEAAPVGAMVVSARTGEVLARVDNGWTPVESGFENLIPVADDIFQELKKQVVK